jgi:hypothetical protein
MANGELQEYRQASCRAIFLQEQSTLMWFHPMDCCNIAFYFSSFKNAVEEVNDKQ